MSNIRLRSIGILLVICLFSRPIQAKNVANEDYIKDANQYLMQRMAEAEKTQNSITSLPKKIARAFLYGAIALFSKGQDIEFYGKVIDQYGNAVSNANIEFYGSHGFLTDGSGFNSVKTNNEGFFHITDTYGSSLLFKKIVKKGYEITLLTRDFQHGKRFPESTPIKQHAKKNTPYIFHAWKQHPSTLHTHTAGYSKSFRINGKSNRVDLLPRKLRNTPSSLNVIFSQETNTISLTLKMQSAGLLEVEKTQYMNLAPKNGYQAEYLYRFDIPKRGRKHYIKHFYFKTAENGFYGKVSMEIWPQFGKNDKAHISFRYMTNLDKNRILEQR